LNHILALYSVSATHRFSTKLNHAGFTNFFVCIFENLNIVLLLCSLAEWLDLLLKARNARRCGTLTLVLAHITPCILNVWNRSLIDCLCIRQTKLKEHYTIQRPTIQHFGSALFVNPISQRVHLLLELRPELRILHLLQVLEVFFVFNWSHHGKAISILEKLFDHSANSIFLLDCITVALLRLESALQVLLLTDRIALEVNQSQTKIADNPQEGWQVFLNLVRITFTECLRFDLEFL